MARHPLPILRRAVLALMAASLLASCAGEPPKPPPPLAGARATVFRLAGAPDGEAGSAAVCSTTAGHCPVPAGTPAGLRCTCETGDGSAYAGRTGGVPPIPDWADGSLKPR